MFRQCITNVLKKSKLKKKTINTILDDPENIRTFEKAFTHYSYNAYENYEFFELIGDSVLNNAIVIYFFRKYPALNNIWGVTVLSRLKINLISTRYFAAFARDLGFQPYIKIKFIQKCQSEKVLEDVFEAFFGALFYILDLHFHNKKYNKSFLVIYQIVEQLLDNTRISFAYNDLFDAKTRLKETFDCYKNLGALKYEVIKDQQLHQYTARVYKCLPFGHGHGRHDGNRNNNGDGNGNNDGDGNGNNESEKELMGIANHPLKGQAEQEAAKDALVYLKERHNVQKPLPHCYLKFQELLRSQGHNENTLLPMQKNRNRPTI